MDWIVGLPRTVEGYDVILTVTDRLTKMIHFIPTRVESDAVETAHLFLREVVRLHGLPREIVSDRDPRFTGEMWREMCRCLGIRQALSTAYHPRTDGQSEHQPNVGTGVKELRVDHATGLVLRVEFNGDGSKRISGKGDGRIPVLCQRWV